MNNKLKNIIFLFCCFFILNCSFDKKTGFWSGSDNEKKRLSELRKEERAQLKRIKVYSSDTIFNEEITPANSVELTKPDNVKFWTMSGKNLQNFLGHIYLTGIENNHFKKKIGKSKNASLKKTSAPIFSDNSILVTDDKGFIYKTDLNGKINWKKNIYKKMYKRIHKNLVLSIHEDVVYVADNIGFVYAVSFINGELIWLKNHGIPIKSNVKIFDGKMFVINQDNRILCYDIKDGSKIWDVRSLESFIKLQNFLGLAISKNGKLIVLNSAGDLFKANTKNGRVDWYFSATGATFAHDSDFMNSSEIVLTDDDIIFSASSSTFSFNQKDGYLNWKSEVSSSILPIINGNNIFLTTDNGYFVNLDKSSGKIIWSTNVFKILKEKKQNTHVSGFVLGSNKVYITTYNGFLIVASAITGEVESFKKIGEKITSMPVIYDSSLYILTQNSSLIVFN